MESSKANRRVIRSTIRRICFSAAVFTVISMILGACTFPNTIDYSSNASSIQGITFSSNVEAPDETTGNYYFAGDAALSEEEQKIIMDQLQAEIDERLDVQLIEPNEYSRPGDPLTEVNNVVVHYLGNPGTTGQENSDYFHSLAETGLEYASCHFIIGLEGEIIQLIPLTEISYCSNDRNADTISIECCHPDESGVYTDETYESLVLLCAWLCGTYGLNSTEIIRHYDVTGKLCPLAFVAAPDYWYGFKSDVANAMGNPVDADTIAAYSTDSFATEEEIQAFLNSEYRDEENHGPEMQPNDVFGGHRHDVKPDNSPPE